MNFPETKALEIATTLVNTRLQNTTIQLNQDGGKSVVEFFEAIYNGVKAITENINN